MGLAEHIKLLFVVNIMAVKRMSNVKTYLMLFFGMALFGSATPLSKLVTQTFPVFVAGGLRVLLAFTVLAPFVRLSNFRNYKGKDLWLLLGIGFIGVLGFTAFMLYGMKVISGITGSIVMSATPALTAVLSAVMFKEGFGWKKLTAILLAVAGVLLLQWNSNNSTSNGRHIFLGVLLVVAAIFCEACYTLMGKALTRDYAPEEISALSAVIAFAAFIPPALWQLHEFDFVAVPAIQWIYLLAYGAGTMGLGSVLWYKGIKQVQGSIAATFMGVMPISALVLSYILLGDSFRWIHLAGFGLVFAGVLLIISVHRQMQMDMKH